jgi:hypothetical protein
VLYSCKGKENNLGAIALISMDTVFMFMYNSIYGGENSLYDTSPKI